MTIDRDDKYAHLLQPIRDLASNWNINIANELEEYLEALESVTFSFKGGQSLNFAEAALVIQGSACVYSKKVEYLHSLVFQALDYVAERKVKAARSSKGGEGEVEDDDEFDDEEHFLSLDDTLEEAGDIDLEEDCKGATEVGPIRLPATLLALEDAVLPETQGDGAAGNYRIASCAVHHSGALLLEARDGLMLDEQLRPLSFLMPPMLRGPAAGEETDPADQPMAADDGDYDCGGGDGGFYGDDDDVPMNDAPAADYGKSPWQGRAGDAAGGTAGGMADFEDKEEAIFDPYKPLDPSDTGSQAAKPFKKMSKHARRPRGRPAAAVAGPALVDGLLALPAPAAGLLFPEFGYALQHAQQEESKQAHRAGKGAAGQLGSVFTLQEAEALARDAGAAEAPDDYFADPVDHYFDDGGNEDMFDAGAGAQDDDFEDLAAAVEQNPWARHQAALADAAAEAGEDTYVELLNAHVQAFIKAAADAEVQSELAARVSTWRSKMAPALQEEDARPEFDIHIYGERILDGLAGLKLDGEGGSSPQESEEEARESAPPVVVFGDVLAGSGVKQEYDVPRVFSSMLQLVNNGNLRIEKNGDESTDFSIALLTTALSHKRIGDSLAPSSSMDVDGQGEEAVLGDSNRHKNSVAEKDKPGAVEGKKKKMSKRQKA